MKTQALAQKPAIETPAVATKVERLRGPVRVKSSVKAGGGVIINKSASTGLGTGLSAEGL